MQIIKGNACLKWWGTILMSMFYSWNITNHIWCKFQFTGSLSDSLGILNFDDHHNERREELKISGTTSRGGHLLAGIKGLGYGLKGGLFSIPKQFYEGAREEGIGVSYVVVWSRSKLLHICLSCTFRILKNYWPFMD